MPACGTVTTSPASSTMLLRISPVSSKSFRLIVIEVARGSGPAGVPGAGPTEGAVALAGLVSAAEGKVGLSVSGWTGLTAGAADSAVFSWGGSPEPGAAEAGGGEGVGRGFGI